MDQRADRTGHNLSSSQEGSTTTAPPLSLIIPVYNEGENIARLVSEIESKIPRPYLAYIVYDFDGDNTVPAAKALAQTRPWLRLLKNDLGRGVVYAIRAGFQEVREGPAMV